MDGDSHSVGNDGDVNGDDDDDDAVQHSLNGHNYSTQLQKDYEECARASPVVPATLCAIIRGPGPAAGALDRNNTGRPNTHSHNKHPSSPRTMPVLIVYIISLWHRRRLQHPSWPSLQVCTPAGRLEICTGFTDDGGGGVISVCRTVSVHNSPNCGRPAKQWRNRPPPPHV